MLAFRKQPIDGRVIVALTFEPLCLTEEESNAYMESVATT